MYLVNRTCVDCGNRYSYSNETPPELKDCPYCVALEQIASNVRAGRAVGLDGEAALALADAAELAPDMRPVAEPWQPPSVADDAALEAEQERREAAEDDYYRRDQSSAGAVSDDDYPDEPQGQHRHPNG